MIKINNESTYKGTRILVGNEKRELIDKMIAMLRKFGFDEISIPVIQHQALFEGKVGAENNNLMFNFKDRGDRDICLAPEYTAVVQQLANSVYKHEKDVKLFYIQECFRGEKPQAGRYRQFTQLGVEILHPTEDYTEYLSKLAVSLITNIITRCPSVWYQNVWMPNFSVNKDVSRGLDYYIGGKGFEISYELLGAQKQICGGGMYDGGMGFAIGIDRLLEIEVPTVY